MNHMFRNVMLTMVTLGIFGCSSARAPRGVQRPLPQALPSRAMLCPPESPDEDGNPQSRSYRGGCLGNFGHFYAGEDVTPPGGLPERVTGYHYELGDIELEIRSDRTDTCVSSGVVPLYDVRVMTSEGPINPCEGQSYMAGGATSCDLNDLNDRAIAVPGAWDAATAPLTATSP